MTNQTEQGAAPRCWYIEYGRYGQITMRQDEADRAAAEGKRVIEYTAVPTDRVANPTSEGYTSDGRDAPALDPVDLHYDSWPRPTGGMQVGMPVGVLMRHKPTGITVIVDNHRSQHRNRDEALRQLAFLVNFCTFKDKP